MSAVDLSMIASVQEQNRHVRVLTANEDDLYTDMILLHRYATDETVPYPNTDGIAESSLFAVTSS